MPLMPPARRAVTNYSKTTSRPAAYPSKNVPNAQVRRAVNSLRAFASGGNSHNAKTNNDI